EDINFKKGFIDDVINSIDFSIEKGFTEKNNLYIYGEKSTALAIQVLLNKKPDFFKKVILSNPSSYIFSNQKLENKKLEESILNYKIDSHPYYNIKDTKYSDIFMNTEIDNTESIKYLSKIKSIKNNKSKSYLNIQKEYDLNKTFSDMYYFLLN
ncbi:MAG: hypothetical protein AABZ74_00475, partial [Cyanobacteriota bacterium]